ncbi:hypothetical protein Tco_1166659 [Tanacetum coccineum]
MQESVVNLSVKGLRLKGLVSDLEASVSDEEIRKAVWGCGENKSPGPDGFTFEFFRKFWTVVGPDFSRNVGLNSKKVIFLGLGGFRGSIVLKLAASLGVRDETVLSHGKDFPNGSLKLCL